MPEDEVVGLIEPLDAVQIQRFRDDDAAAASSSPSAHVGNNDVVGAAIAHMGLPLNVVADDSSFPELFELLRAPARAVARDAHPVAQPAGDLRRPAPPRAARPAGRLGLPQRRDPGAAVRRVDDAAGRAGHAGRQDVVADHARDHDPPARRPAPGDPRSSRSRSPSSDPADLQRATQAIADALAETIRPAPEQWYSFKPIWPATEAEAADLERRALAMQAGRPDPGPARDLPRDEADQVESSTGVGAVP